MEPPLIAASPSNGQPVATPIPAHTDVRIGIAWMLLTMLLFVAMDTLAKYLTQTYPVPQVVWARYAFHLLVLMAMLGRRLPATMRSQRLGLQLVRSLLLLITTVLFFTGISLIPLVDASAIMFMAPIMVTALSVPLLREPVGPHRWAGVVIAFAGALLIIRPGTGVMQAGALLPLGAALTYAFYQIATRKLSHADPPLTTLFYTASLSTVLTSAVVPFFWVAPDLQGWVIMVTVGILGGIGHFALIKAVTAAPPVAVAPFSYSSVIWATLFGFLVFGDLPDYWTVIGAAVIIASGLYIYHRERLHNRKAG